MDLTWDMANHRWIFVGWQEQVLLDSFRSVNVFESPDEFGSLSI